MNLEYLTDSSGSPRAVVVPIAEWTRLIEKVRLGESNDCQQDETDYLLSSSQMKTRLLEAKNRLDSPARSWVEVKDALGI